MQNSDLVDVVGLTPVPSPLSSEIDEGGRIRCVCGNEEDDGFTIQCDSCLVWQHSDCVGILRNNVPEVYLCEQCRPEEVDVESGSGNSTGNLRRRRQTLVKETISLSGANEISENIVSLESQDLLQKLADSYGEASSQMPESYTTTVPLRTFNFQLTPIISILQFSFLQEAFKMVEVRELRSRNLGKRTGNFAKFGVFALEDIDPGTIIGEYLGQVQPISLLSQRAAPHETVSQSNVLITSQSPGLFIDARKFGNSFRHIRRSCRSNCEIKLALTPEMDVAHSVHWCIFATNAIREMNELFLPFDYSEGNNFFRYECACPIPDLCLAEEAFKARSNSMNYGKSDIPSVVSSVSAPIAEKNITMMRRSSSNRKLSREERKLQQYIEFFERMETAEKKHRKHGSGPSSPPQSPRKRGRKSLKKDESTKDESKLSDFLETDSPSDTSSTTTSLSPQKTFLPIKKMLVRSFTINRDQNVTSELPTNQVSLSPTLTEEVNEDLDVVGINSNSNTDNSGQSSVLESSTLDTPSKKRVSLSDYLSRRKSSPTDKLPVSAFNLAERDAPINPIPYSNEPKIDRYSRVEEYQGRRSTSPSISAESPTRAILESASSPPPQSSRRHYPDRRESYRDYHYSWDQQRPAAHHHHHPLNHEDGEWIDRSRPYYPQNEPEYREFYGDNAADYGQGNDYRRYNHQPYYYHQQSYRFHNDFPREQRDYRGDSRSDRNRSNHFRRSHNR